MRAGAQFDPDFLDQYTTNPAPRAIQASGRPGNVGEHAVTDPATRRFVSGNAAHGADGGGAAANSAGVNDGEDGGGREDGGHWDDGEDGGHAGGAEDGVPPPPEKKKTRKKVSAAQKNKLRHEHFSENRAGRTDALTVGVPDSKAHEQMMLESDKAGRLAMLVKAPCPRCGKCIFVSIPTSFIRVRVFSRCGTYEMVVLMKSCVASVCQHAAIPGAEAAACFAAQAEQSRTGSLWFARDLLDNADPFLFHGSAFKVRLVLLRCGPPID